MSFLAFQNIFLAEIFIVRNIFAKYIMGFWDYKICSPVLFYYLDTPASLSDHVTVLQNKKLCRKGDTAREIYMHEARKIFL